jgi:hypothetical protein
MLLGATGLREIPAKGGEGGFADMMLDALRVGVCGLDIDSQGDEKLSHNAVARA